MPTRHGRHRARSPLCAFLRSRRGQAAAVVAVLTVATVVVLLVGREGPDRSTAGDLLAWAQRELPTDTRLRADPDVRAALRAAGAPDALVTTSGPDDGVVVVTGARQRPDGRVLARFGDLVLADPSPGVPTPAELEQRQALAGAVLANPTTRAPEEPAAVLRSADVDMRLLSLLAGLAAREGIGVAAFPRADGAQDPARSVLLSAVGGAAVGTGEPATEPLRTWLAAQRPPYAPDHVEVTDEGVLLDYRYVSDADGVVADAVR